MNQEPKSKLRWRLLRWGLLGLAVLVTLVAALVTEENWRGKRAWENYKSAAEARGEHFDLASVIPPAVPDDQNFFCAPIVAEAWKFGRNQDADPFAHPDYRMVFNLYRGDSEKWPAAGGNWQKGELTDLKQWQRYFRTYSESPEGQTNGFPVAPQPQTPAADILLALSSFSPAVEELRLAARRPSARPPLDYDRGFDAVGELLPCLANVKKCGQLLQLRILAELKSGQSGPALEDVKLLLRVTDSLRTQPFLISHLVRLAMMSITLQPIYEGLAQHRWSEVQLAELAQELVKQDYLADFELAMRGEKLFAIATFEKQRITRESKQFEENSGTNKIVTISYRFMPEAYFYQNELNFARMHEQFIQPLVNLATRIAAPVDLRRAEAEMKAQMKYYSYYKLQALMVYPAISRAVTKFATMQAQVDLARVACALERYQLAHGEYPQALDSLAPQLIETLPHDIINGQPLHYRRTEDGKFVLYSVGLNEKDDSGQVVLTKTGRVDREKGDWVWQYPLK